MALKKSDSEDQKPEKENKGLSSLSQEELIGLISKLSKQVEDIERKTAASSGNGIKLGDVKDIINAVQGDKSAGSIDYSKGISEEQIPMDDYHEAGVRFCAPFIGYAISDDVRKGYTVKLPFNKDIIFFEFAGNKKTRSGKAEEVSNFSVYTSHSKREIEFLKTHTMYGVSFYDSSNDALRADTHRVQRLIRVTQTLQGYDQHQIIQRCKEYGLAINMENMDSTRFLLAQKMVEREIDSEKTQAMKNLEIRVKENGLLNTPI